ncbi:hypothetical protein PPYR_05895 [Photinus pyralis]|uniref:Uncharacterized protein n=1 Tax=Photinus pyralis TaxID=7054 RepID=A0A1Y1LIZ6_PHOPY|nr:zinc finger MYM-type protein 3-like [Photinus pyralis]XP_031336864.1 zinc finger MYM-type protein 3-like [Photinus pyralis]KAB0801541.1 hypothetical protein PPYR_05895 [Photinus pyralis]
MHSLEGFSPMELNTHLTRFMESEKDKYRADILMYICLEIQRYLGTCGHVSNIFIHSQYTEARRKLNECALSSLNCDNNYIRTSCVSENYLWESGHLNIQSPYALLWTVVYYILKNFKLPTVEEHTLLELRNLSKNLIYSSIPGVELLHAYYYFEPNGLGDYNCIHELAPNRSNISRCPFKIMEFYLSKSPPSTRRSSFFYLKPVANYQDSEYWFEPEPLPTQGLSQIINRFKMVYEIMDIFMTDGVARFVPWEIPMPFVNSLVR